MTRKNLTRRDFNQLAMTAMGGVVAGTLVGCGGKDSDGESAAGGGGASGGGEGGGEGGEGGGEGGGHTHEVAANDWTGDIHVCRGLNACKGKGAGGENACAGQGTCATAKAHACHTMNDCKFQGGCEDSVGVNACKGKGACAVPLGDNAWKSARSRFEEAMQKAEKEFGDAPAKEG